MKNIFYFVICALSAAAFSACSDDDKLPTVTPSDRGTVTDNLGNTYGYVRIGNQLWTTSNALNGTDMADLTYYNNFEYVDAFGSDEEKEYVWTEYQPAYGNLMTYADAVASAPDGWRLPSDADWQKLERALGMSNPDVKGFRGDGVAYKLREDGSGTELAFKLGGACVWTVSFGLRELDLDFIDEFGYFWTSTLDPSYDLESAYFRKIFAGDGRVDRNCATTDRLMSVRWVKDVE